MALFVQICYKSPLNQIEIEGKQPWQNQGWIQMDFNPTVSIISTMMNEPTNDKAPPAFIISRQLDHEKIQSLTLRVQVGHFESPPCVDIVYI